jgi:hypothetical protein
MPHFFEPLESRVFLSASAHKADSPTIVADLQRITDTKAALAHDVLSCRALQLEDRSSVSTTRAADLLTLRNDALRIRADRGNASQVAADKVQLAADRVKLREDLLMIKATSAQHNADCKATFKTDRDAIKAAQLQLRTDRRNRL